MRTATRVYLTIQNFKEGVVACGEISLLKNRVKPVTCNENSNACLPDYTKLYGGRGGMWRDFFDEK